MLTRTAPRMKLEHLEARDVPAVMIDYAFNPATATYEPAGGNVLVSEIGLTGSERFMSPQGDIVPGSAKSPTANDNIIVRLDGSRLTLFSADGIFAVHRESMSIQPVIISYGTTVTIENVTDLTISLQLGGDDTVVIEGSAPYSPKVDGGPGNDKIIDNSTTTSTLRGGSGDDTISAAGTTLDPQLFQFALQATRANPALMPLLAGLGGVPKTLAGDDGNDVLSVTGFGSGFVLDGGTGNDTLTGPQFGYMNTLRGGDGDDTVIGGWGLDVFDGGSGSDILVGFGGGDIYLTQDGGFDLVLNQKGDTVFTDPFDARAI